MPYKYTLYVAMLWSGLLALSCNPLKKVNSSFAENVVIAHRGAWQANNLPQNSIAALREAIKLGCAGSEFDVRMTVDDSLIVTHDADFAGLPIEATGYEELSETRLENGEVLPTLRNYLIAGLENNTETRLICEIKPSETVERNQLIADKVLRLVEELGAEPMVIYISFSYDILKRVETVGPNVRTQYLEGNQSPKQLKADGIDGADYHFSVFKNHPEWIVDAKENGVVLNAWTVDEKEDIDWLLANDFDFITTDAPTLVLEMSLGNR